MSTLFISIEYSIWGVLGNVDYFHMDNNSGFQRLAPMYFLTINSASGITLEAKSVVGVNWHYSIDVSTSWWSSSGKLPIFVTFTCFIRCILGFRSSDDINLILRILTWSNLQLVWVNFSSHKRFSLLQDLALMWQ